MISCGIPVFFLMTVAALLGSLIIWFSKRESQEKLLKSNQHLQQTLLETRESKALLSNQNQALKEEWLKKNSSLKNSIATLKTQHANLQDITTELKQSKNKLSQQFDQHKVLLTNAIEDRDSWKDKFESLINNHKKILTEVEHLRSKNEFLEKTIKKQRDVSKSYAKDKLIQSRINGNGSSINENKPSGYKLDIEAKRKATLKRILNKKANLNFTNIGISPSQRKDNLKDLKGLGSFVEAKLNTIGIVNLTQLASLNSEQETLLNEVLELPKNKFQKEEWVLQSKIKLGLVGKEENTEDVLKRIKTRIHQFNFNKIDASSSKTKDKLIQIKEITQLDEQKLNALGIFTFCQIAAFDVEDVAFVNGALEIENGRITNEDWVEKANAICVKRKKVVLKKIRDQKDRLNWDRIEKASSRKKDNLQSISGINRLVEEKLNVLGIQRFEQVSNMNIEDIHQVASILEIAPHQIIKEKWVEKAKTKK